MLRAIVGFRLVTADPACAVAFYRAIGFVVGAERAIPADEMQLLGLPGGGTRTTLTLGDSRLDLDRFDATGRPYPAGVAGADTRFQHLALVSGDVAADWARAQAAGATAIGRGEPITLPASSGGVTAIKFRDPEGHPLEFLRFPEASNAARIDHSAIAVADIAASRAFYRAAGLAERDATLNRGATQAALDGLDDPVVDVVPMDPPGAPPHLELLGYRSPATTIAPPPALNDIAATRIVWAADRDAVIHDPDGHAHQLVAGREDQPARSSASR